MLEVTKRLAPSPGAVPQNAVMTPQFKRYVAIGDSSTEGLQDPDGAGGYRGWANRLAERVAEAQGGLLYANLGVRGKRSREIRQEQLGPALALDPDLATIFAGSNDILERGFNAGTLRLAHGSLTRRAPLLAHS